jgi:hypothetical protein
LEYLLRKFEVEISKLLSLVQDGSTVRY